MRYSLARDILLLDSALLALRMMLIVLVATVKNFQALQLDSEDNCIARKLLTAATSTIKIIPSAHNAQNIQRLYTTPVVNSALSALGMMLLENLFFYPPPPNLSKMWIILVSKGFTVTFGLK